MGCGAHHALMGKPLKPQVQGLVTKLRNDLKSEKDMAKRSLLKIKIVELQKLYDEL